VSVGSRRLSGECGLGGKLLGRPMAALYRMKESLEARPGFRAPPPGRAGERNAKQFALPREKFRDRRRATRGRQRGPGCEATFTQTSAHASRASLTAHRWDTGACLEGPRYRAGFRARARVAYCKARTKRGLRHRVWSSWSQVAMGWLPSRRSGRTYSAEEEELGERQTEKLAQF